MMLSLSDIKEIYPDTLEKLRKNFLYDHKFPCLFAIASFKKEVMKFLVFNSYEDILKNLPKALNLLKNKTFFNEVEKTYETLILISNHFSLKSGEESNFIRRLLSDLSAIDTSEWPKDKTKDFDDQDYEFYWGGVVWFPVLLHKEHKEIVRNSPLFILALQPGSTFEFNKNTRPDFYGRMRGGIHKRIDCIYSGNLPFYLSNKSSGKNICQYSGSDDKEKTD